LVVLVRLTRQAPQHHLAEAVHPFLVVPSQPPPLEPPQRLPLAVHSLVVAAQLARSEARQARPLARLVTRA
jgi:hypothetical protein